MKVRGVAKEKDTGTKWKICYDESKEKELNERFTREGMMGDGVERVTHCQATQSQQIFFFTWHYSMFISLSEGYVG